MIHHTVTVLVSIKNLKVKEKSDRLNIYESYFSPWQSVERLTAEREVAGSIPGAGPLLRVLK